MSAQSSVYENKVLLTKPFQASQKGLVRRTLFFHKLKIAQTLFTKQMALRSYLETVSIFSARPGHGFFCNRRYLILFIVPTNFETVPSGRWPSQRLWPSVPQPLWTSFLSYGEHGEIKKIREEANIQGNGKMTKPGYKEEPSLIVFFSRHVRKNESKYQNIAILFGGFLMPLTSSTTKSFGIFSSHEKNIR